MVEGYMLQAIIKLWQDGKGKKAISRAVGHDIKTVRKIIKTFENTGSISNDYHKRVSLLDNYKDEITKLFEQNISNLRIFETLQMILD